MCFSFKVKAVRRKLYTTFGRQCALDSEFQQTFLSQIIKNFSFSGPGPHFPGSPSPLSAPCLLYAPTSWLHSSLCQYRSCYKIQQLRAPRHTVSHKMLPTSLNLLTSSSTITFCYCNQTMSVFFHLLPHPLISLRSCLSHSNYV